MKNPIISICAFFTAIFTSYAGGTKVINVSPKEAQALLTQKDAPKVIDIRTPEEFKNGHLKNAQLIDFKKTDFEKQLAKLDRTKAYLLHCRSGGRSTRSLKVWKKLGFKKLYHLNHGILSWEKAGFPIEIAKTGK